LVCIRKAIQPQKNYTHENEVSHPTPADLENGDQTNSFGNLKNYKKHTKSNIYFFRKMYKYQTQKSVCCPAAVKTVTVLLVKWILKD